MAEAAGAPEGSGSALPTVAGKGTARDPEVSELDDGSAPGVSLAAAGALSGDEDGPRSTKKPAVSATTATAAAAAGRSAGLRPCTAVLEPPAVRATVTMEEAVAGGP